MQTNHNEGTESAETLRIGLITDEPRTWGPLIANCPQTTLAAQAGMPRAAALPEAEWFDDSRALVARAEIDGLLLLTSPRAATELTRYAAERGVHVWRPPPLARNFAEAAEAVRRAEAGEIVLRVASWWEHVQGLIRDAERSASLRPIRLTEIDVRTVGPPLQSWRSSRVDAGAGVLMQDAYPQVEALVGLRGLPESVHGQIGRARKPADRAPRETEDVAGVLARYPLGSMAILRASWDIPPYAAQSVHHGDDGSIRYCPQCLGVLTAAGEVVNDRPLLSDWLSADLRSFADAVRRPPPNEQRAAHLERHLAVSALLDAVYLSARTGSLESPRKFYEVQGWPEPRR
jgi:predicted dehydrogenase